MAAIVNDRDVLLQAASVRKLTTAGVAVVPTPSSSNFYSRPDGSHGPDYVRISVATILCDGPFTFAVQGAKLSNITATTADIAYADMTSALAIVTVTAANAGTPVQGSCIVGLVSDGQSGQPGQPGTRGAGTYYATGGAWSDSVAKAACPSGVAIVGDVVTISNGTTYALTKKYDGSAWAPLGGVYDGSLFVTGSIQAPAINTNGMIVRDLQGNPIVGINTPLADAYVPNTAKNSLITVNSDGSLNNAGSGKTTLAGIGMDSYRILTAGISSTSTPPGSLGLYRNGAWLYGVHRSYTLVAINRSNGLIEHHGEYDVYGAGEVGGATAATLSGDLNYFANNPGKFIVIVYTYDEPNYRKYDSGLDAAMYRNGASRAVYGSPQFRSASAYALVGISGCGEGNGAEAYQGSVANDVNAWIDVSFSVVAGNLTGVTLNYVPKTLHDYGYTGDMNATLGADSSNLKAGTGRPNLVDKNSLPVDLSTFNSYFSVSGGSGPYIARGGSDGFAVYGKDRRGCIYVHGPTNPPAGTNIDIYRNDRIQILAGKRYEFGITLSTHRCKAFTAVAWYDSSDKYIGENYGNEIVNNQWYTLLATAPPRSTLIITPPATAVSAMLFVRQLHTGDTDPYTFASQWYAAEALPGQTEPSPYSASPLEARDMAESAATGLLDKLSQTAGGVMKGQVVMQASGAIVAGNASWSGPGYGGTGAVMSPYGFACIKNGAPTFAASVDGNVVFAGQLSGAYGSFGALQIASGGYISQNYYGTWDWAAKAPGPGFLIHQNGMLFGDRNDTNYGYVLIGANGTLEMPGFSYSGRQLTLSSTIIVNPNISGASFDSFAASLSGSAGGSFANTSSNVGYGTLTASPSGGRAPYTYQWTLTESSRTNTAYRMNVSGSTTAQSLSLVGFGSNCTNEYRVTCIVTDANGRTATIGRSVTANHGTPP